MADEIMRSITEMQQKGFLQIYKETIMKVYTHDWIFSSILEKSLIIAMLLWSCWSVGLWIWRIF